MAFVIDFNDSISEKMDENKLYKNRKQIQTILNNYRCLRLIQIRKSQIYLFFLLRTCSIITL